MVGAGVWLVALLTVAAAENPQSEFTIERQGRRIQLDGFLLEWREADARPLGPDSPWRWDALNTPEGIAGYFHAANLPDTARYWTFVFEPAPQRRLPPVRTIPGRATSQYAVAAGAPGHIAVEWIVPWDSVALDAAGNYRILLSAQSPTGEQIGPIVFLGMRSDGTGAMFTRLGIQAVMIVALVIVYFIMRSRLRTSKSRRRRNPRMPDQE